MEFSSPFFIVIVGLLYPTPIFCPLPPLDWLVKVYPLCGEWVALIKVLVGAAKTGDVPLTGTKVRTPKYAPKATITAIPPIIM